LNGLTPVHPKGCTPKTGGNGFAFAPFRSAELRFG
jgi:hypothetical protein